MLVCVYTCQSATLLEITCHGSIIFKSPGGLSCCLFQDSNFVAVGSLCLL